jgi:hypothetical protein
MENDTNDDTTGNQTPIPLQRNEFINFLNSEIHNLRSEIKRPGWTTWALLASIATCVWLILSEIQTGNYSITRVEGLLLILWLTGFLFLGIIALIKPTKPQTRKFIFSSDYQVAVRIFPSILIIVLNIFFIFVAFKFNKDIGKFTTFVTCFVLAFLLLGFLTQITLRFSRRPISTDRSGKTAYKIYLALFCVFFAIPIWQYYYFLIISPGPVNIFDVRFALLVAAIIFLVMRLSTVSPGQITLDSLISINREFNLRKMDLNTAIRQTDIALTGLNASEAFEIYVSQSLKLLRDAESEHNKCVTQLDKLEKLYSEIKASPSEGQWTEIKLLIDSIYKSIALINKIVKTSYPTALKPLEKSIYRLGFNDLKGKLNEAIDELKQHQDKFDRKLTNFIEIWNKAHETTQIGHPLPEKT